ncbi:hypothetical protein Scep_001584 [Stephania cephalantha]|uniref:Uncharacterized protein n=1 Tax=Stephania cephalantha TaxID=152367 RepID=A0AAP0L8B4_9MAGN
MTKSKQASKNRRSEKNKPGTGVSKHIGDTKSFASHKETLDEMAGEPVSDKVLFNYTSTKGHDNVNFVDERSCKLNEDYEKRLQEMTQASPDVPVDENELFYEISPRDRKGCIYGLGSYARPAHNRGGTSSSQAGEILRLTEEVTYLREGQRRTDETMSHLLTFFRQ